MPCAAAACGKCVMYWVVRRFARARAARHGQRRKRGQRLVTPRRQKGFRVVRAPAAVLVPKRPSSGRPLPRRPVPSQEGHIAAPFPQRVSCQRSPAVFAQGLAGDRRDRTHGEPPRGGSRLPMMLDAFGYASLRSDRLEGWAAHGEKFLGLQPGRRGRRCDFAWTTESSASSCSPAPRSTTSSAGRSLTQRPSTMPLPAASRRPRRRSSAQQQRGSCVPS